RRRAIAVSAAQDGQRAAPLPRRRRPMGRVLRQYGLVALFMAPWIIGFLAFILYPMVASLYYSFTNYDLLSQPHWVWLQNYKFMFTSDPFFWQAMRNTVWIILISIPIQIVFALGAAVVLTRIKRGAGVYRTIFYVPTMVPIVAAALGFVFLLNPAGPVNHILGLLHLPQPLWFQDPHWAKPV